MESPDRPANSAAESQGSPIFDFLCTLSPIKPVKTAHLVQTFSEITFAPPPVFVSPKTESRRCSISLKRNQTDIGDEDLKDGFVNCEIVDQSHERQILLNSVPKFGELGKGNKQKGLHGSSPSSSPSKFVEDYLAEPMEDGQNMGNSVKIPIKTVIPVENTNQGNQIDSVSRKDIKKLLAFDQGDSELEFLMLEGEKLQQHAYLDESQESQDNAHSLIGLSTQQVEGYIASLKEVVEDQTIGLSVEMQAGSTSTRASLGEVGSQKQGSAISSVNMTFQRGLRRRCLDFEAVDSQTKSNSSLTSKTSDSVVLLQSYNNNGPKISISALRERASVTSSVSNTESANDLVDSCGNPSLNEEIICDTKHQAAKQIISNTSYQKNTEIIPTRSNRHLASAGIKNSSTGAVMPSGIGLHLNSLTRSMTFPSKRGITVSTGSQTSGNSQTNSDCKEAKPSRVQVRTLGKVLSDSDASEHPHKEQNDDVKDGSVVPYDNVKTDGCKSESECLDPAKFSSKSVTRVRSFTIGIKSLEDTEVLGKRPCPLGRKRVLLPDLPPHKSETEGEAVEEPSSTSPKKKKKSSITIEKGDGCKRCNCKKSKCLKLYCECFAAGVYCVDSCSCHDCFNKPESEEIVMETRQQIESRNPLAFAPKIVHTPDSAGNNGQDDGTPANSGRHKRGCNCKRSHCLKKYCECFQAGVGCSDGCRCENCKNSYGKKSGADDSEEQDQLAEALDKETSVEQTEPLEICEKNSHGYNQQDQNLSPITPSLQCAGESRIISNLRSVSKRRLSSDELPSPAFSLSNINNSRSPTRLLRPCKGKLKSTPSDSSGMPLPKIGASPVSTPRILRIGQFSPRWDGLDDICTVTPLAQAPSRPTPASTSVFDGSDSSPSINVQNYKKFSNNSKFTSPLSASQCETPADLLNTPMTEIFSSTTSDTGVKSCAVGSDSFFSQLLCGDDDDDDDGTPEFLKEPEQRDLPVCLLNSSSPKHKRVSPPHIHASREGFNRRGGRKFILQSVPTVPPSIRNPKMET